MILTSATAFGEMKNMSSWTTISKIVTLLIQKMKTQMVNRLSV
jgi:hypothetical protein